MTTLAHIIDAMMVSDSPADTGSFGRVEFWHTELGHLDIPAITEDDVEDACLRLAKRGKLTAGRNMTARPSGKPLAPATITNTDFDSPWKLDYATTKKLIGDIGDIGGDIAQK